MSAGSQIQMAPQSGIISQQQMQQQTQQQQTHNQDSNLSTGIGLFYVWITL